MNDPKKLVIYIDGAAKGNPGPAGVGIIIYDCISKAGKPLRKISEYLGQTTNNVAEYLALVYALEEAIDLKATHISIYSDSQLLVRQFEGLYKVKNQQLKVLYAQVQYLIRKFGRVEVKYIARERNRLADNLASEAIKQRKEYTGGYREKELTSKSSGPLAR